MRQRTQDIWLGIGVANGFSAMIILFTMYLMGKLTETSGYLILSDFVLAPVLYGYH